MKTDKFIIYACFRRKMRVDLEEVEDIQERRWRINSVPLDEIEWFKNGKRLKIYKKVVKWFEYTGLNNIDFIFHK